MGRGGSPQEAATLEVARGSGRRRVRGAHGPLDAAERWQRFVREKLNVVYINSDAEAKRVAKVIRELKPTRVGVDFETASKNGHFGTANGTLRTIQLGFDEPERGIRPMQVIIDCHHADPKPFLWLFRSRDIEKEIQYMDFEQEWALTHLGVSIQNIYDTCIAAQVIRKKLKDMPEKEVRRIIPNGLHENNKLGTLTRHFLDMEMPKENQRSDWSRPQLRSDQVVYAAMDVAVMFPITDELKRIARKIDLDGEIDRRHGWIRKRIGERAERLMERHSDDAQRLMRAMHRARDLDELKRVWKLSRQMTVFAPHAKAVAEYYRARRKELKDAAQGR